MNKYVANESITDPVQKDYGNWYLDLFKQVPSGVPGGYQGNYIDKGWNMIFLDNFAVCATWMWNKTPAGYNCNNRLAGVLATMQDIYPKAKSDGIALFANIWSDFELNYFTSPLYSQLADLLDYGLLEEAFYKYQSNVPVSFDNWIRRINLIKDAMNRRMIPIIDMDNGDRHTQLTSLLLACEPGKCMMWFWTVPEQAWIDKVKALDNRVPLLPMQNQGNCYYRPWTDMVSVVNPSDSSCTFTLGMNSSDFATEVSYTSGQKISIPAHSGKILLKR